MMKPRTVVTIAAAVGLSLSAFGAVAVPHGAATLDTLPTGNIHRVAMAFAAVPEIPEAVPALERAALRVAKGDFMERPGCFGQVWPDISPECLSKVSGTVSLPVRTITVGYQLGDASTVLVRMPAPQVASR